MERLSPNSDTLAKSQMAYVPGFHYDLFVSYATEDCDERMVKFINDLRLYLVRELGKLFTEHSIFFDRTELSQRPANWVQELEKSAGATAILVPLLTPSYATSAWCAREWGCFQGSGHPLNWKAENNQTVYRVLPVSWHPIDKQTFKQLDPRIQVAQQQRTTSIEELGAKLAEALKLMRRSSKTVYLGEAELDTRQQVWDELTRAGYRVLPESPQAYANESTVREYLSKARLAVHFAGGQTQQRAFDAISWSLETCSGATVVYLPPQQKLSDEERQTLEWIEEDFNKSNANRADQYDRVEQKNIEKFLETLRDRLAGAGIRSPSQVGIAFEDADKPAAETVASEIETATGFLVSRYGLGLSDIKKSRAVLFYWGAAEGRRLRKAVGFSAGQKAFLLAPPPKAAELEAELPGGAILRQQGDRFQVDDVRPFLEALGWQR